ncbi:MAG TPA: hypothetical protein VF796_16615, partial [Humisphaera sp.]
APSPLVAAGFTEALLDYYAQALMTREGGLAVVAGLVLATSLLIVDRLKWAFMTAVLTVMTMAIARGEAVTRLPSPFEEFSHVARLVGVGLVVLLLIAVFRPSEAQGLTALPGLPAALFVLQLVMCARLLVGETAAKAQAGAPVQVLGFIVFGAGLRKWLGTPDDVWRLVKAVSWGAGVMGILTAALMLLDSGAAFAGGRLYGPTCNPNWMAANMGFTIPFSLALATAPGRSVVTRTTYGVLVAVAVVLVAATGSRMGMLLIVVGFVAFFRTRLGPLALTAGLVAIGVFALLAVVGKEFSESHERLASFHDTRSETWRTLLLIFASSPVFGQGGGQGAESSYFAIAAGYGFLGLVPLGVFLWAFGRGAAIALRARPLLGNDTVLADLVIASAAGCFAIWLGEGSLLGYLTDHIVAVYCVMALMAVVAQRMASPALAPVPADGDPADHGGELSHDPVPGYGFAADDVAHAPAAVGLGGRPTVGR